VLTYRSWSTLNLWVICITKVSNSISDLQTHSRSLAIMPFDRPYMLSYVFHCSYVSILHCFRDIIAGPKFKDVTWPWLRLRKGQFVTPSFVVPVRRISSDRSTELYRTTLFVCTQLLINILALFMYWRLLLFLLLFSYIEYDSLAVIANIMPRIDTDLKLDFKDVLFRPKRSTIRSRSDVSGCATYHHIRSVYTHGWLAY